MQDFGTKVFSTRIQTKRVWNYGSTQTSIISLTMDGYPLPIPVHIRIPYRVLCSVSRVGMHVPDISERGGNTFPLLFTSVTCESEM